MMKQFWQNNRHWVIPLGFVVFWVGLFLYLEPVEQIEEETQEVVDTVTIDSLNTFDIDTSTLKLDTNEVH